MCICLQESVSFRVFVRLALFLTFDFDEDGQVFGVSSFPGLEWLEQLESVTLRVYLDGKCFTVLCGALVVVLSALERFRELVDDGWGELEGLPLAVQDLICHRIELEGS